MLSIITKTRCACLLLYFVVALSSVIPIPITRAALTHELPELGSTRGELSSEQAYKLGRAWLRLFRTQITTDDNPLLYDYLYHLTYHLIQHSNLKDSRVDLVVINNPQLNAFAVPGGVIGIHNGLLLYAQSEDELAAVIAHEIAHLQQSHYARSREQARQRALPTIAGILAGVLLAATSNTDAGFALLYGVRAASIESQLRYSRRYELEADRTGMVILAKSGRPADAIPRMFERMLNTYRFRSRFPEFLLTHPVTERRIAEGRNAARSFPEEQGATPYSKAYFDLMRTYTQVQLKQKNAKFFGAQLKKEPTSTNIRYGYALALLQEAKYAQAQKIIEPLLQDTRSIAFAYTAADIALLSGKPQDALKILDKIRPIYPNNYALENMRAHTVNAIGRPLEAITILKKQTRARPNEPRLWLMLAESYGLSGNIVGVHEANMEHLILNGRLEEAKQRARYAARLSKGDYATLLRLSARIESIDKLRKEQQAIR